MSELTHLETKHGRNLVVFCDGTGNELGRNLSNVLKLFRIASKTEEQLCFYHPGVGTISRINPWARFRQKTKEVLGLATGYGLDDCVLSAYSWLAENWREGDRIYLFGFSRGAWAVRVLAGFIHLIGLLRPEQLNMCDSALGTYKQAAQNNDLPMAWHFSRVISARHVTIHFLGVWDSVASVLVPRPDRWYLPSLEQLPYTKRNPSVATMRHAIAIDERRRMFRVATWEQPQPFVKNRFDKTAPEVLQDIEQTCFAGVHSDVGGGYPETESSLSKFPLIWMVEEARKFGLEISQRMFDHLAIGTPIAEGKHEYEPPSATGEMHRSLVGAWWILEFLPKSIRYREWKRRSLAGYYVPHAEPREMPHLASIHPSVQDRIDADIGYAPVNLP